MMEARVEYTEKGWALVTHWLDDGRVLKPQGYIVRRGDLYVYFDTAKRRQAEKERRQPSYNPGIDLVDE